MWRYIIIAVSFMISATQTPTLLQKLADRDSKPIERSDNASKHQVAKVDRLPSKPSTASGRVTKLKMGRGGHFYTTAKMNGRSVKVLVDTGATLVAINESTARRLGIRLKNSDFKYRVRTANGIAEAAAATIREIQIGNVRVRNVRASVSRDKALSSTLLGMSFLGELKRFQVDGKTLTLVQ